MAASAERSVRVMRWTFLLSATTAVIGVASKNEGLRAYPFQGSPAVTEVECTGRLLDPDSDLLTLALFTRHDDRILASANLKSGQCTTSSAFSSCLIRPRDAHGTRLRALIVDPPEGLPRVLGCNATGVRSGGRLVSRTRFQSVARIRLRARSFYGLRHITEVECSGDGLPASADLLSIVLYDADTNRVLASVNYAERKCVTSGGFTSCLVDSVNSRNTRVRMLIDDLRAEEVRTYGCDVSIFKAGERSTYVSWSLAVERPRMRTRPFQGHSHITEVECSGERLDSDTDLLTMVLYHVPDKRVLATANLKSRECSTSDQFSSCMINDRDSHSTRLRTLILDMAEHELRHFGCNLTTFRTDGTTDIISWSIYASQMRTTTTSTPTTTTSTTTTLRPPPPGEAPIASGVKSNVQEFQLPISVVIIGLVLLLFFAILCAILVILQCRGKRRRRSRAANRESLLSTKSEPVGGDGGYRTTRSITGYPPGQMPPETPGGNFAMRYQKSIPDTGYVSGSSVYYSEPYGTLDEEMKERLRPNPRMCHIPYDLKGGPLDTHPQEHSA